MFLCSVGRIEACIGFYFVILGQLSRLSSVCDLSAGRFAPLHGAGGEADRREFPGFRRVRTVSRDTPQGRARDRQE